MRLGDIFQAIKKVRGRHLSAPQASFSVNVAICHMSDNFFADLDLIVFAFLKTGKLSQLNFRNQGVG